jgi:hypothetical protein
MLTLSAKCVRWGPVQVFRYTYDSDDDNNAEQMIRRNKAAKEKEVWDAVDEQDVFGPVNTNDIWGTVKVDGEA